MLTMMIDWQAKAKGLAQTVQAMAFIVGGLGVWMIWALEGWAAMAGGLFVWFACDAFNEGRLND